MLPHTPLGSHCLSVITGLPARRVSSPEPRRRIEDFLLYARMYEEKLPSENGETSAYDVDGRHWLSVVLGVFLTRNTRHRGITNAPCVSPQTTQFMAEPTIVGHIARKGER